MDDVTLAGKIAFVTGGSRGIGAHVATALARVGADVAVAARTLDTLGETRDQVRSLGRRSFAVEMEMSDVPSIRQAVESVEQNFGPIEFLINNAGPNISRPATEVTEKQWDQILNVNLKGAFFCAQAVARGMMARRRGRIVNISSAAGLIPAHELAAYGSSKAGLIMLTRVLALEWAPHQITVNAVAPTFVETKLAAQTLDRPGVRDYWSARIPLGRLATVEDVAGAVLYLVSPAADFVTGAVIPVDGGLTMR